MQPENSLRPSPWKRRLSAAALAAAMLFASGCEQPQSTQSPAPRASAERKSEKANAAAKATKAPPSPAAVDLPDLTGKTVSTGALAGKIAVLVWFDDRPQSRASLLHVQKVSRKYKGNGRIVFRALTAEPADVKSPAIAKRMKQWGVELQVLRDTTGWGRTRHYVESAPTLVVLDGRGTVQVFDTFEEQDVDFSRGLSIALKRLLVGKTLWPKAKAGRPSKAEVLRRTLVAASGVGSTKVIRLRETPILPRTEPRRLRLARLWKCIDFQNLPGNILVVEQKKGGPMILVHDGLRAVVQLDAKGAVVARHNLPIPEDGEATYLHTAVDSKGRRYYVAAAQGGPQVYLLDQNWKLLLAYPKENQPHGGIGDVLLADMGGDGTPEIYVGFWGIVGVHRIDLGGKLEWRNRSVATVLSLSTTPRDKIAGDQRLLATNRSGRIVPINRFGMLGQPIRVPRRPIEQLASSKFSTTRPTTHCGLSFDGRGHLAAVGLSAGMTHGRVAMKREWSWKLPVGKFFHPIRPVTSGRLFGGTAGHWVLARPDGSINVISDDGKFSDFFQYGESLSGIAVMQLGGKGVLLVATAKGVTAWQVQQAKE